MSCLVGPARRGPGRLGPRAGVRGRRARTGSRRRDAWWREVVAHAVVRDEVRQPGTGPVAFGSLPFADDSAEPGALVVPEVVVGRRGDRWWVTTIGHDAQLPPIPSLRPSEPADAPARRERSPTARSRPDDWKRRRRPGGRADQRAASSTRSSSPATSQRTRRRADRPALAARAARRALRHAPGCSRSTAWSAPRPSCWSAARRAWSPRGSSPAPSGAPATTRTTSPWRRRSPGPARTSRSTSTPFARSPTPLAPHCSSMNVPETPFVLHLCNVMHLATDVAGVAADHATSLGPRRVAAPDGGGLRDPGRRWRSR